MNEPVMRANCQGMKEDNGTKSKVCECDAPNFHPWHEFFHASILPTEGYTGDYWVNPSDRERGCYIKS
jgi:hypothetical protein